MLVNIFFSLLLFLFIVMIVKQTTSHDIAWMCLFISNEYVKNHNIGFNYRDMELFAL